jgi:hypothetical protein
VDGAATRATPLRHVEGVAKQGRRQAASLATTQPKKQPKRRKAKVGK